MGETRSVRFAVVGEARMEIILWDGKVNSEARDGQARRAKGESEREGTMVKSRHRLTSGIDDAR